MEFMEWGRHTVARSTLEENVLGRVAGRYKDRSRGRAPAQRRVLAKRGANLASYDYLLIAHSPHPIEPALWRAFSARQAVAPER
jgi:hypothetical protein